MADVYTFKNEHGDVLYVGCSAEVGHRIAQHASEKPWWPEATTIEVQHFASTDAARRAEASEIALREPRYNIQLTGLPNLHPNRSGGRPRGFRMDATAFHDARGELAITAVADLAGVSRPTVSSLLAGRYNASPTMARKIADALAVPVNVLFPEIAPLTAA